MFETPFSRIKTIVTKIQQLQDKLANANFMPMAEQKKHHDEIKKLREEMALLEKRTKPK
jgi:hypothetical protein